MTAASDPDPALGNDPLTVFHVGNLTVTGGIVSAEQQLCVRFGDHRGRVDTPALGVLFDHIGGFPFALASAASRSAGAGGSSLQARLTMSALGHIEVGTRLSCRAELAAHDERSGVTRVEIRTGTGRVCCVGTVRSVHVGRTADVDPYDVQTPEVPDCADMHAADGDGVGAYGVHPPDVIAPSMSGRDVVNEIAAGVRSPGALVRLLGGRVEVPAEAAVGSGAPALRFVVQTAPWMGNTFGTMHGGVILTIVGHACSLAGQQMAAPGTDYELGDLSVGLYRSPAVHGTPVTVEVTPVKTGRRIASVRARMTGPDDLLLAEGVADIHYS